MGTQYPLAKTRACLYFGMGGKVLLFAILTKSPRSGHYILLHPTTHSRLISKKKIPFWLCTCMYLMFAILSQVNHILWNFLEKHCKHREHTHET